jgi:hypothetical protein
MWAIRTSSFVLIALAMNHLIHGFGCWGLQPGGRFSALLCFPQLAVAAGAMIGACRCLFKFRPPNWGWLIGLVGVVSTAAFVLFYQRGLNLFSSAHFQGIENLAPFLSASASAMIAGFIQTRARIHSLPHPIDR